MTRNTVKEDFQLAKQKGARASNAALLGISLRRRLSSRPIDKVQVLAIYHWLSQLVGEHFPWLWLSQLVCKRRRGSKPTACW